MKTKNLLFELYNFKTQSDISDKIEQEIKSMTSYFKKRGFNFSAENGLEERQQLSEVDDLLNFQYFRDLHFMKNVINGVSFVINEEIIHFTRLKGLIEALYLGAARI